jgi:hypothetical protein
MESHVAAAEITAKIELPRCQQPIALLVRFRHPKAKPIRPASVNGRKWTDFDVAKEWIRIAHPAQPRYVISTHH